MRQPRRWTRPFLLSLTLFSAACATPAPEVRFLKPEIPAGLLTHQPAPDLPIGGTLRDLGRDAVGMEQAHQACAVQLDELGALLGCSAE